MEYRQWPQQKSEGEWRPGLVSGLSKEQVNVCLRLFFARSRLVEEIGSDLGRAESCATLQNGQVQRHDGGDSLLEERLMRLPWCLHS